MRIWDFFNYECWFSKACSWNRPHRVTFSGKIPVYPCVLLTSRRKIGWNTHLFFLQTIGYQCGRKILHSRAQWPKWMGSLVVGQAAHGFFEGWTCQLFTNYTLFAYWTSSWWVETQPAQQKIFETGSIFPNFLGWRSQNMWSKPRSPPTVDVATKPWKSVESGHLRKDNFLNLPSPIFQLFFGFFWVWSDSF